MANTIGMEAVVEIDENERYWVGKGFGKGGLLPNDRAGFSSTDGSLSWASPKEASEDLVLLGRGWTYYTTGEAEFHTTQKDDPERCWMYATDFRAESIKAFKPDRGVLHWVRFRRLNRIKVFNPNEFVGPDIYEKCDHCDSSATEALSKQMLEILAYCSLLHNATHMTDAVALPLKNKIIDLAIGFKGCEAVDAFYQMDKLRKELENFVEKERAHTIVGRLLSGIDFSFYGRHGRKEFKERSDAVATRYLPKNERDAIASLIVRKLDSHFQIHCDKVDCGEECRFARVECPNDGCSATMSKIYLEGHDAACPYKIFTCDCGESFKQKELVHHQSQVCMLRDVDCPFAKVGCVAVVKACNMKQHVTEKVATHQVLALNRMMEQEEMIKDMKGRIATLEHDNKDLKGALEKHEKSSANEIKKVEAKIAKTNKSLDNLEATSKKEFKKINTARSQLT